MKIIGMIPARGGSTRFNNKPLALICGKPMLYWVWKHSSEVALFDELIVATDSQGGRRGLRRQGDDDLARLRDRHRAAV